MPDQIRQQRKTLIQEKQKAKIPKPNQQKSKTFIMCYRDDDETNPGF